MQPEKIKISPELSDAPMRFDGAAYDPKHDQKRLTGQILRVFSLMLDGRWRTLSEIEKTIGDPAASVSAQLRHLRKERFGSHIVDKRARGNRSIGLWEYRLTPTSDNEVELLKENVYLLQEQLQKAYIRIKELIGEKNG